MPFPAFSSVTRCLLGAGLLVGTFLSTASAAADIKQLRDWTVACDNLRACSAYGFDTELSQRRGWPGQARP